MMREEFLYMFNLLVLYIQYVARNHHLISVGIIYFSCVNIVLLFAPISFMCIFVLVRANDGNHIVVMSRATHVVV